MSDERPPPPRADAPERDPEPEDLPVPESDTDDVKGGSTHNVLKLRHDTAKNSLGN
jgi:hypothetical protein